MLANFTFIRFNPIISDELELEYTDQVHDIAIQVLEHIHQSIESRYHRNADIRHRSIVIGREIVNDHCGEQVVVLVGNFQIG